MLDVAIIGAGPVGLAAALAATRQGIEVSVLEAQSAQPVRDPRVFALSYGARLILERLEVWSHIAFKQPIRSVHVSERGAFGSTVLDAAELGLDALGYVVRQPDLLAALRQGVSVMQIECLSDARVADVQELSEQAVVRFEQLGRSVDLPACIVVAAEGGTGIAGNADTREREYDQHAVVAEVRAERANNACAYERFTPRGPIALLPLGETHALIWTVSTAEAAELAALDGVGFEQALCARYGERIGAIRVISPRASFPLKLRYADQIARKRIVRIGNSAQTLHPVAGQGFNLGLRDAYELAQVLGAALQRGEGLVAGLHRYQTRRRFDRLGGTLFTDLLIRTFSNENLFTGVVRSLGLAGLDALAPAKKFLLRRLIFGAPR